MKTPIGFEQRQFRQLSVMLLSFLMVPRDLSSFAAVEVVLWTLRWERSMPVWKMRGMVRVAEDRNRSPAEVVQLLFES